MKEKIFSKKICKNKYFFLSLRKNLRQEVMAENNLEVIKKSWGDFGLAAKATKDSLAQIKANAEADFRDFKIEKSAEAIKHNESVLKRLKSKHNECQELRKKFTQKLDQVISNLMQYEKDIEGFVKIYQQRLLDQKKMYEHEVQMELRRQREIAEYKNYLANYRDQAVFEFKSKLLEELKNQKVRELANCLALAAKISVSPLELKGIIPKEEFDAIAAKAILTDKDREEIAVEVFNSYTLGIAEEEQAKEAKKMALKQELDLKATQLTMFSAAEEVKPIKTRKVVIREDSQEFAMNVIKIFFSHAEVMARKRTKGWLTLSVESMVLAIESQLNDPNNTLTFSGISISEQEKL